MSGPPPPALPDAAALAARVAAHRPRLLADYWAATALVLTDADRGPELLVIRRLTREGDRWSGDMALPGGKRDPGEVDPVATAARETWEETRVQVGAPAGRLDDLEGRPLTRTVATAVFTVEGRPDPVPEPAEVAEALWLPLADLVDPGNHGWYRYRGVMPFPSITVGEHMIWGLTHRLLTSFMAVAGLR